MLWRTTGSFSKVARTCSRTRPASSKRSRRRPLRTCRFASVGDRFGAYWSVSFPMSSQKYKNFAASVYDGLSSTRDSKSSSKRRYFAGDPSKGGIFSSRRMGLPDGLVAAAVFAFACSTRAASLSTRRRSACSWSACISC